MEHTTDVLDEGEHDMVSLKAFFRLNAVVLVLTSPAEIALGAEVGFITRSAESHKALHGQPALTGVSIEPLPHLPGVAIVHSAAPLSHSARVALMRWGVLAVPRVYRLTRTDTPDPELWRSWHLFRPRGMDAEIFKGWAYLARPGTSSSLAAVTVAVIDSGVDLEHPELAPRLSRNPAETPANGRDDDGNGFVDDDVGWNFAEATNRPQDDLLHGTHVAGIIAAAARNGVGSAGVSPNARLLPIRVFDASGVTESLALARAIDYAVGRGARIINASWGDFGEDSLLEAAIRSATDQGVLFVTAAGNDGADVDSGEPFLPCGFGSDGIVCVGATDEAGHIASFSNYGHRSVDLFAPGVAIFSTVLRGEHAARSGTSMAAPVVSGIAATLWGRHPEKSPKEIKDAIVSSAANRSHPSLSGKSVAPGVVSLLGSLGGRSDDAHDVTPPQSPEGLTLTPEGHFAINLKWNCSDDDIAVTEYLVSRDGTPLGRTPGCGFRDASTAGNQSYSYAVVALDWAGNTSAQASATTRTPAFGEPGAWSLFPLSISSPHPYPNGARLSWDVAVPEGYRAKSFRIRFQEFNTEDDFDVLNVFSSDGTRIASYSGELGAFLSQEIPGDRARLELVTDGRNAKPGFSIDALQALLE